MRTLSSALAITILAVAPGCGGGGASSDTRQPEPYAALVEGLCQARARAAEPDRARQVFFDRAHQPLHELASAAATGDRGAAARLLEAKQAVERDLGGDATRLGGDLDRLLDATRRAIAATGQAPPNPCQEKQ